MLALQDIFLDDDGLEAFLTALRRSYFFSYHVPPQTSHDGGCAPVVPSSVCENVLGLRTTDCAQRIAADLLGCLVDHSIPRDRLTTDDVFSSICGGHAALLLLVDPQCVSHEHCCGERWESPANVQHLPGPADAEDPRCVVNPGSGPVPRRGTLDLDHVLVRDGSACLRPEAPKRFTNTPGISDHAGLRVCKNVFERGGFPSGNFFR